MKYLKDSIYYYMEVYGCEMNKSQANSLRLILEKSNIFETEDFDKANFIIIFTCSVRKSAEDRAFGRLSYFKKLKKNNSKIKIILAGCMSEEYKNFFIDKGYADFIIGTKYQEKILDYILVTSQNKFNFKDKNYSFSYNNKENYIINIKDEKDAYINLKFISALEDDKFNFLDSRKDKEYPFMAYVNIVHGCSNFCSYCIVPYLRGKEISRRSDEIIDDVKKLADEGVNYIILLGQNVLFYGKDNNDIPFYKLLQKIHEIKGIEYISFLSPHPKDFNLELIKTICELPKVTKVIHLPLQSGSDKILKLMNRKYTISEYLNIVETFYKFNQNINFTTDIIVGFPEESEEDYKETLNIVNKIRYIDAFTYKYSKRPLVKEIYNDNIDESLKDQRLNELINIVQKIAKEKRKENIGKTKKSIILKESKKSQNYMLFKTFDGFNGVVLNNQDLFQSKIVNISLKKLSGKTFIGELENVKNNI